MTTRVARYVRVSSLDGIEDSYSPEVQRSVVERYCQQQGWTVVADYQDLGISGWRPVERPGFTAMIADARQGKFDIICVYKLDRFSRRTDSAIYRTLLQQQHVRVVSATEPTDDNAAGEMLTDMLSVTAQFYSAVLSERIRASKRVRAEHGLQSGDLPHGYCRGKCETCHDANGPGYCPDVGRTDKAQSRTPVPHPRDRAGVVLAFETYAPGDCSLGDVARMLNQAGYRTSTRYERRGGLRTWTKFTVDGMLRNPFYIGMIHYRGNLLQGKHEPLVTADLFAQVQQALTARRRVPQNATNAVTVYPLTGILFCADCGHPFIGQCVRSRRVNGEAARYYYDRGKQRGSGCARSHFPAQRIEAQIVDILAAIHPPQDWQQQLALYYSGHRTAEELERERYQLELRKGRLRDVYLAGLLDHTRFLADVRDIEKAQAALNQDALAQGVSVGVLVMDFRRVWDGATPVERKTMLHQLLARVELRVGEIVRIAPRDDVGALLEATGCTLLF
jgi:site-specific DNA recombinase